MPAIMVAVINVLFGAPGWKGPALLLALAWNRPLQYAARRQAREHCGQT